MCLNGNMLFICVCFHVKSSIIITEQTDTCCVHSAVQPNQWVSPLFSTRWRQRPMQWWSGSAQSLSSSLPACMGESWWCPTPLTSPDTPRRRRCTRPRLTSRSGGTGSMCSAHGLGWLDGLWPPSVLSWAFLIYYQIYFNIMNGM